MFSWKDLFASLLTFVTPLIKKLIEDLFAKAAGNLGGSPDTLDPATGLAVAFRAAKAETWRWEFRKRRALAVAEQYAGKHPEHFYAALRGQMPPPKATRSEQVEMDMAV